MNDLDLLSDRLDELSQSAPAPAVDPLNDIRRGQRALRRRRTRSAAGFTTALVAVAVISATVNFQGDPGNSGGDRPGSTARPRIEVAFSAVASLCLQDSSRLHEFDRAPESRPSLPVPRKAEPPRPQWEHPAVAPQLAAYRQAAAAILDPFGTHLAADVTNIQFGCNMANSRLTSLGTTLGLTSSGALGMVRLEVVSPDHGEKPQIVINHDRWTATEENLPAGVTKAWVADYQGGQAVYVKRQDGLTVAVDVTGTWGNNAGPGSPPARDLPTIDKLLMLAASESLTLPVTSPRSTNS